MKFFSKTKYKSAPEKFFPMLNKNKLVLSDQIGGIQHYLFSNLSYSTLMLNYQSGSVIPLNHVSGGPHKVPCRDVEESDEEYIVFGREGQSHVFLTFIIGK